MGFIDDSKKPEVQAEQEVPIQAEPVKKSESSGGVQVETVQPKEGKAIAKARVKTEKKKRKINIWLIAAIVVILLALTAVFKLKSMLSSDSSYLGVTNAILKNEVGSFTYTFDIRTSAHTDGTGVVVDTSGITELNGLATSEESTDDTELSEGEKADGETESSDEVIIKEELVPEDNKEFTNWTSIDGAELLSACQYPKYRVVFSGCVTSLEPYTASFNIDLITENYNNKFTDIIAKDGYYYINMESIRSWLVNSRDTYLISLGEAMPEGSKYMTVSYADFAIPSRFAEDGDEQNLSSVRDLRTYLKRMYLVENMLQSCVTNGVDLDDIQSANGDTYMLNVNSKNGELMMKQLRYMALDAYSCYKQYIEMIEMDDTQKAQATREGDNFMSAMQSLILYMYDHEPSDYGLQMAGTARKYKDVKNRDTLESNVDMAFATDSKDYNISISMMRSGGITEVEIPQASTIAKSSLTDPDIVLDTMNSVVDYFNPMSFQLYSQLEYSPERVKDAVRRELVNVVNSVPESGIYLTVATVPQYLKKYTGYIATETSSEADLINANIVKDFLTTLNDVTGGIVIDKEVEAVVEEEQYPEIKYEDSNVSITCNIDESKTDVNMIVLNMHILNKSTAGVDLDLTNFSIQTLLRSVYPANNEVMLRNYDNAWDMTTTPQTLSIPYQGFSDISVYFVVTNDTGYMDLWYGNKKIGVVANY